MILVKNSGSNGLDISGKTILDYTACNDKSNLSLKIPSEWLKTASNLSEAFSYMNKFAGEAFIIKCGRSVMSNPTLARQFAEDVVMLKKAGILPIIVSDGSVQIEKTLKRLKIKESFVDGIRIIDSETMEIVEMVYGSTNNQIVTKIISAGGMAINISGKDGGLIEALKLPRSTQMIDSNIEKITDFGFVGELVRINPVILQEFAASNMIPVISPIGLGINDETLSIDANAVAGAIASTLAAKKLILINDCSHAINQNIEEIRELSFSEACRIIKQKSISDGMIAKLKICLHAIENDCETAHILDGSLPHALLMATFTKLGASTMLYKD